MISLSKKQVLPRFFFSSFVLLLIFLLSGCNLDNDTSSTPSPDQQSNGDNNTPSTSGSDTPTTSNQPPKARITAPQTSISGQTVTLNGNGSSDSDDDPISYKWTQTGGESIALSDRSSSSLTFVAPSVAQPTQFTFQLTVDDGKLSNTATVSILISSTADNTAPSIVTRSPQPDQSGVSITAEISVGFDEALLETSVNDQSLLLSQNGAQVPAVVSYDSAQKTIRSKPASALTSGATYTVTLAETLEDLSGNTFPGDSWSFSTGADTIADGLCATAVENNSMMLSCPTGQVIKDVTFASYGNPGGMCGSFTMGSCNASSSEKVVSGACKGKNSCTLVAGSDAFGNPCEGTAKKLAAQVVCGMPTDNNTDTGTDTNKPLPKHWHETGGYGTDIEAGLGGKVYKVTNLNKSGAGSLGEAINASGERLVVFEVGGVIDLEGGGYTVKNGHITIAGETAPSPGITLVRGNFVVDADDVVVSHIAVQYGTAPEKEGDAANNYGNGVVFNHVSIYWAVDENLSMSPAHNTTIYKCIIAEGLSCGNHEDGEHSKGSLIYKGTDNLSLIGTLYVHNALRNPRAGETDIVIANGVVYNWAPGWDHVGPVPKKPCVPTDDWFNYVVSLGNSTLAFEGNVGIQGPESVSEYFVSGHQTATGEAWMSDNIIIDPVGKPLKMYGKGIKPLDSRPFWPEGLVPMPAHEALYEVLRTAGSRPGDRDIHNARVIGNVANGDGMIIDSQDEVGGYADYAPTSRTLNVPDGLQARRAWLDEMEDAIAVDRNVDLTRLYNLVGSAASDKLK